MPPTYDAVHRVPPWPWWTYVTIVSGRTPSRFMTSAANGLSSSDWSSSRLGPSRTMPTLLLAVGSTNVSTVKPTDANAGPRSGRLQPVLQVVDLVGHQDGDHVGLLGRGAWCGPRQHGSVAPGLTWGRTDNLAPRPRCAVSVSAGASEPGQSSTVMTTRPTGCPDTR